MKHRGRGRGQRQDLPRATMVQRGVIRLALAREASPGVAVDANDPRLAVDLAPYEDPDVGVRTAGVILHEKLPDTLVERFADFAMFDSTGVRLSSSRNDDTLAYLPIQIGKTDSLGAFTEVAQVDLENARVGINGTPTEALHVQGGNILTSHELRWMDGGLWEGRLSHANTGHRTYAFQDLDGTVAFLDDIPTTEEMQDLVGAMLTDSGRIDFTYNDGAGTFTADLVANSVTFAYVQQISTDRLLGRDTAGSGNVEELTVSGGVEFTGTGIQRSALTGDVMAAAGNNATTIANDAVTVAKLADAPAWTFLIRNAGSSGDPSWAALADFTTEAAPAAGDYLLLLLDTGEIRKVNWSSLPAGGGGGGIGTVKEANVNVVTSATILDFDGDDFDITDQTGGEALVEINRNTADGIAGLDSDAKVPVAQLPDTFDAHAWSSPSQLMADVNDYAFSGGDANKSPQRIDLNGVWAITGIAAKNGGWEYVIRNVSIHQLRISNENTGSSAANRIITNTGSNILLNPEQMARLIYDDSKQRWIAYPTLYITESNVLLDNNKHSDTTNHACLRGAVIVGNSTPQWTRVSVGTNGQVLGTDGTDTTFRDPVTKISGSSGAAGPFTTWQALTSDAAAITSTTTPGTTVMTTTGLAAGTWRFKYHIIYRSAATTTGLGVAVNHSGTTSMFVASGWFVTSGTTQATGVADQTQATNTGQLVEGKSERVKNTVSSSSAGVDTANVDCLLIYEGTVINSTSGSLELKINTEVASSGITIKAGTNLVLEKVN